MPDHQPDPTLSTPETTGPAAAAPVVSFAPLGAFGVREEPHASVGAPIYDLASLYDVAPTAPSLTPTPSPVMARDAEAVEGPAPEPVQGPATVEADLDDWLMAMESATVAPPAAEPGPGPASADLDDFLDAYAAMEPEPERPSVTATIGEVSNPLEDPNPDLDLPRALATDRNFDEVFGFEKAESAALLMAFPHYEAGVPGSHLVSRLEARIMLATITQGVDIERSLDVAEIDRDLARLVADGYLRPVPNRGPMAEAMDEHLRLSTPEALDDLRRESGHSDNWGALVKGSNNVAFEITGQGIAAARVMRAWQGQGDLALPDGTKRIQVPVSPAPSVAVEGFSAGWEAMVRRMELDQLGAGDMGRYFQGELAAVAGSMRGADPHAVVGKVESVLLGMRYAALAEVEMGYTPDHKAPLRPQDIDGAIRLAESIMSRVPSTMEVEEMLEDGARTVVFGVDKRDVDLAIASLEGVRLGLGEIATARPTITPRAPQTPDNAWQPIQGLPHVHEELSPLALEHAAKTVRGWLDQVTLGVKNSSEVAKENFDQFLRVAYGADAPVWRDILAHPRPSIV